MLFSWLPSSLLVLCGQVVACSASFTLPPEAPLPRLQIRRLFATTALVAAIVVGSAGDAAWAPLRLGKPESAALLVVLGIAVVLGGVGAWVGASLLRRWTGASPRGPVSASVAVKRAFPGAVASVALIGLLGISWLTLGAESPSSASPPDRGEGREGRLLDFSDFRSPAVRARGTADEEMIPRLDRRPVPLAAAILVVLAGGAAVLWWIGKRRGTRQATPGTLDAVAARGTVLRSIDAMLADPDPHTAVIGAYAQLLEGLADAGVARHTYEAPLEHLRRVLAQLQVRPEPTTRLVDLFELARFSAQPIRAEHREQALDALHQVAADLGHQPDGAGEPHAVGTS